MTRETKLCYLHLPLWLFGIKPVSPFVSLFNAPFILLSLSLSVFLSVPPCPIEQSKTCAQCSIETRKCKLQWAHSVSVLCQKQISRHYSTNFHFLSVGRGGLPISLNPTKTTLNYVFIHIYIKVASQEEFCCAKQRLFGFCHESQTSHIIPTTPASTF